MKNIIDIYEGILDSTNIDTMDRNIENQEIIRKLLSKDFNQYREVYNVLYNIISKTGKRIKQKARMTSDNIYIKFFDMNPDFGLTILKPRSSAVDNTNFYWLTQRGSLGKINKLLKYSSVPHFNAKYYSEHHMNWNFKNKYIEIYELPKELYWLWEELEKAKDKKLMEIG